MYIFLFLLIKLKMLICNKNVIYDYNHHIDNFLLI